MGRRTLEIITAVMLLGELPAWTDSGDGDGSGSGDGDGDGSGYWLQVARKQFPRISKIDGSVIAFWKSDKDGLPINGGDRSQTATAGLLQEVPGPLRICTDHALHATMKPEKWKGERLWIVALYGEVMWQEDKVAALRREIIGEVEGYWHS